MQMSLGGCVFCFMFGNHSRKSHLQMVVDGEEWTAGEAGFDSFRKSLDNGYDDAIAKLFVGLRIADGDTEGVWKAHEAPAFTRGEASRILSWLLDEDFAAVFIVPSGESAGSIMLFEYTAPEPVSFQSMFLGVGLEVVPQLIGQIVFWVYLCLSSLKAKLSATNANLATI